MAEKKNYHQLRYGTALGEIKFGHIHDDNEQSSVMLRSGSNFDHYITMEATGKEHRKGGTICRSPGSFQIKAGENITKEGDFGVYIDAASGDLVLRAASGKIRIEAQNIEMKATGKDGKNGNIVCDANEKFLVRAQIVDVSGKASTKIFSEGTVNCIGNQFLNLYGGMVDAADAATNKKGSKAPSTNEEQNRGN